MTNDCRLNQPIERFEDTEKIIRKKPFLSIKLRFVISSKIFHEELPV
jgi:hypothetical protein